MWVVGWREGCFDWWPGIEEAIPFPVRCQRLNIHLAGGPEWLAQIPAFRKLYAKIKRHKEHIPGTIRPGTGNARVEATNNKIRLIIRKSYGFRNIGNMMDRSTKYAPTSASRSPTGNQSHENPHDHRRKQQSQPTRMPEEPCLVTPMFYVSSRDCGQSTKSDSGKPPILWRFSEIT